MRRELKRGKEKAIVSALEVQKVGRFNSGILSRDACCVEDEDILQGEKESACYIMTRKLRSLTSI